MDPTTGVDFRGAGGRRPLGSDTEGGEICLGPLGILASNAHLALSVWKKYFWERLH